MGLTRMITATLILRPTGARVDTPSAEVIADVLWAHARPVDRIEHIRVRAGPDAIAIYFFVLAVDQAFADTVVHGIEARVRTVPVLCGWTRA